MGLVALNKNNIITVSPKSCPQSANKFQPAGTTADDNNLSFQAYPPFF